MHPSLLMTFIIDLNITTFMTSKYLILFMMDRIISPCYIALKKKGMHAHGRHKFY